MAATTSLALNTGAKIPVLGLGTWKSEHGKVKAAVEAAIDAGYRHIDCAYLYKNEGEVGEAIQSKIKEGVVKREDLFITTKLWSTYFRRIEESFSESLKLLQVDYVDLYLMHWPFALEYTSRDDLFPVDEHGKCKYDEGIHYLEVWKQLEQIQKSGRAKAIGVSNFNKYQIEKIWKTGEIKPAVHQYEIHPFLDQDEMLQFCKTKGIVVTGYSPFGSPDRPWAKPDDPSLLEDPQLKAIAAKHAKTVAQVLLRYQLQRGTTVIPKSVTPSRIQSNAEIFDFDLSSEDRLVIKTMNRNWRAVHVPIFCGHKYFPFKENYSED